MADLPSGAAPQSQHFGLITTVPRHQFIASEVCKGKVSRTDSLQKAARIAIRNDSQQPSFGVDYIDGSSSPYCEIVATMSIQEASRQLSILSTTVHQICHAQRQRLPNCPAG